MKAILASLFLALPIPFAAPAQTTLVASPRMAANTSASIANPVDWVVGDLVVAAGNGSYQVWHSPNPTASKPSYTKLVTVNDGVTPTGGGTAGCTFDSAYRLFTTNF